MKEVFGIVWQDAKLGGIPLTLNKPDAQSAIATAQDMHAKAGDTLVGLRAVHVAQGSDVVETLWSPAI